MKKVLLSTAVAVLLLTGCGEDKKASSQTEVAKEASVVDTMKNAANDVVEKTSEAVKETANEVVDSTKDAVASGSATVESVATEAKEVVAKKVEEVKESTKEAVTAVVAQTTEKTEEVKDAAATTVESAKNTVEETAKTAVAAVAPETTTADGAALFKACASCHGQKAEMKALGKSQVIAGWDKQKIVDALTGYKNGTYGGAMKGIMVGQVSTKSEAEIDALAEFISNL